MNFSWQVTDKGRKEEKTDGKLQSTGTGVELGSASSYLRSTDTASYQYPTCLLVDAKREAGETWRTGTCKDGSG